eukprot:288033-Chlamydomonas_euryale.AAC.1
MRTHIRLHTSAPNPAGRHRRARLRHRAGVAAVHTCPARLCRQERRQGAGGVPAAHAAGAGSQLAQAEPPRRHGGRVGYRGWQGGREGAVEEGRSRPEGT